MAQIGTASVCWGGFGGHVGCMSPPVIPVELMQHELFITLFSTTAGFTASGIAANIYRLVAKKKAESGSARIAYLIVMVIAGPTVLFENSAKAWRAKSCTGLAFGVAASIAAYWSLAIGLFIIQLGTAVR